MPELFAPVATDPVDELIPDPKVEAAWDEYLSVGHWPAEVASTLDHLAAYHPGSRNDGCTATVCPLVDVVAVF